MVILRAGKTVVCRKLSPRRVKGFFMRSLSPLAAVLAFALVVLIAPSLSRATIIAFTNFDEPASGAATYTAGSNPPGHELGFTIADADPYVSTARDHTDATTDVDGNDGGKSYYLYRTTTNTLFFDTVNLTNYTNVNLWLWLYVPDTDFESNDQLTMTIVFNDDTTFTLLDIFGGTDDGGFSPYKGQWSKISTSTGDIPDAKTSVYLKIKNYVSEGGEDSWIDDVFIVPEPATLALMGFGMAGILWLSRRKYGNRSR